jgi:hypothetical protein
MTATGHSAAARGPRRLSLPVITGSNRRLCVAVLVVVLAAGAVVGSLELRSTAHFVATRPLRSAFAKQDATEAGGRPPTSLGNVVGLRFIPSARFEIGIFLTNEASRPVTLTAVRVLLPSDSVIRRAGRALLAAWDPPPCPSGASCPARGGIDPACRPGEACNPPRPVALEVAPGKSAVVQLNLRFLACPLARHASLQDVSRIEVSYRDSPGTIIHQRLGLATSTLMIDTPHPCSR